MPSTAAALVTLVLAVSGGHPAVPRELPAYMPPGQGANAVQQEFTVPINQTVDGNTLSGSIGGRVHVTDNRNNTNITLHVRDQSLRLNGQPVQLVGNAHLKVPKNESAAVAHVVLNGSTATQRVHAVLHLTLNGNQVVSASFAKLDVRSRG